jgi:hypothetical protein
MPFTRNLPKLTALLFLFAACYAGESAKPPIPPPPADMAAYAKEHGLDPAVSLNLGGGVKLEFVLIPAGKFTMGSPETEKDRSNVETQHEVTISKPFYMGVYEVTVDQYALFVKDTGQKHEEPIFKQTGGHPVVGVSWDDAQAFCKWLSKKTGKDYRLLSEAMVQTGRCALAPPRGSEPAWDGPAPVHAASKNSRTTAICSGAMSMGAWPTPANSCSCALGPRCVIASAVASDSRSESAPRSSSTGHATRS